MNNLERFKAANALSPVVSGAVREGGGAHYVLKDGSVWDLSGFECSQIDTPVWEFAGDTDAPLTAEQLQAQCDAFVKGLELYLEAMNKFVVTDLTRIKQLFEASALTPALQAAMLQATIARMGEVSAKYD